MVDETSHSTYLSVIGEKGVGTKLLSPSTVPLCFAFNIVEGILGTRKLSKITPSTVNL